MEKQSPHERRTSNIFSMFDKTQILELKEVFNMIDQDCDGFIDKNDLMAMFQALGEEDISEDHLQEMIKESPSYINLTMFLTLFGNKLNGTDPDDIFEAAFRCLDAKGTGRIHGEWLKNLLTQTGDKFTDKEMVTMLGNAKMDSEGYFDYVDFIKVVKYGTMR